MTTKIFNCKVELSDADVAYLAECCRKRNISFARLCSRLFKEIVESKLVLSVLDDNDQPDRVSGLRRRPAATQTASPPLQSDSRPKPVYQRAFPKPTPSKESLREEIARAMANTAAMKV